jgi:hypothetical protein
MLKKKKNKNKGSNIGSCPQVPVTETGDNFQFWPPSSYIAELFTYIPDEWRG